MKKNEKEKQAMISLQGMAENGFCCFKRITDITKVSLRMNEETSLSNT